MQTYIDRTADWALPVTTGDDYELVFTLPRAHQHLVLQAARSVAVPIHCIGHITAEPELQIQLPDGSIQPLGAGYDHFNGTL